MHRESHDEAGGIERDTGLAERGDDAVAAAAHGFEDFAEAFVVGDVAADEAGLAHGDYLSNRSDLAGEKFLYFPSVNRLARNASEVTRFHCLTCWLRDDPAVGQLLLPDLLGHVGPVRNHLHRQAHQNPDGEPILRRSREISADSGLEIER
jgi:hypothetical protein